tara:strand:+ start:444 stop:701 length:258 start_codon:yes stop_codon:yes gene_type:complete
MKGEIKIGQLIYIPSSVSLLKFARSHDKKNSIESIPEKYFTIKEPLNLLVTEVENTHPRRLLGVHYLGETWYVNQKDVYGLQAEI